MSTESRRIRVPESAPEIDLIAPIVEIARRARESSILCAFGAPDPDGPRPEGAAGSALLTLHLAATYHRLAVVCDVMEDFRHRARVPPGEPVYLADIQSCMGRRKPRHIAATFYRRTLTTDPRLAEAHYGFARVAMALGDRAIALEHFSRVVELSPHPDAPDHANLHANAYWHLATLLEDRGDNQDAHWHYNQALSRVANFGVHHVRVAHFFRNMGLIEEAATQYQQCMGYSHLYFAEFMPPPLAPVECSATNAIPEPIYTTSRGEIVVYWEGSYHAIPGPSWPAWSKAVRARTSKGTVLGRWFDALGRHFGVDRGAAQPAANRAHSIAEFEEPGEPEAGMTEPAGGARPM